MKKALFTTWVAVILCSGIAGCYRGPKMEEHQDSSEVGVTGDPHITDAPGGQGSGATGTGGDAPGEPSDAGAGDPDTASGGDSSN